MDFLTAAKTAAGVTLGVIGTVYAIYLAAVAADEIAVHRYNATWSEKSEGIG